MSSYLCSCTPTPGRGSKEGGSEGDKVFDSYDRNEISDNGKRLLSFATNHDLIYVKTFFRTSKGGAPHTLHSRGKINIDYTLTR